MSWMMAVGAGVSLAGNMLGNRSAKKGQQAQARLNEEIGRNQMGIRQAYGAELQGLADPIRDSYAAKYANVDNGFATARVDPRTGQVTSSLTAPWSQQRDMFLDNSRMASSYAPGMFQAGNQYFADGRSQIDKALAFDPQSAAQDRYKAAMGLLAPQDATNQQNLMQELYSKSGFGLTLGTPAAGGGTTALNPYVNAFENSRNQRNAQLSWDSLNEGQRYVDSLFNRGAGLNAQGGNMFNMGGNMMNLAGQQSNLASGIQAHTNDAIGQMGTWSDRFTNNNNRQQDAYWKTFLAGREQNAQAQLGFYDALKGNNAASGANNRSQMFQGIGNSVGSLFSGGAFGSMFGGGQVGGAAGGGMPAGSAYDLNPGDLGMFGN